MPNDDDTTETDPEDPLDDHADDEQGNTTDENVASDDSTVGPEESDQTDADDSSEGDSPREGIQGDDTTAPEETIVDAESNATAVDSGDTEDPSAPDTAANDGSTHDGLEEEVDDRTGSTHKDDKDQHDDRTDQEAITAQETRGVPAVWSILLGLPFVIWGGYVLIGGTGAPSEIGIPILVFGLFVIGLGLYIHLVAAPEPPMIREDEEIIDTRKPAQRAAIAKISLGMVFLFGGGYLLFATFMPYIYPIATGFIGLYFFSTGLYAYWTNTLTTYYVTNQRLIKEYRFISLVRQELTFEKVRGVEERKSIWETLVGLGNVRVASGGGGTLEVVIRNIYSPTAFANEIRTLV